MRFSMAGKAIAPASPMFLHIEDRKGCQVHAFSGPCNSGSPFITMPLFEDKVGGV